MKIFTSQRLLFTLILSGMSFVVVGHNYSTSLSQNKPQTRVQIQQGYGRAPYPPLTEPQTRVETQQGYGHAPYPPLTESQTRVQIQQGYGHAPHLPLMKSSP